MKSKGHGLSVLLYNLFSGSDFPIRRWFSLMPAAGIKREDISWSASNSVTLLDPGIKALHRYSRVSRIWNHVLFFVYLPRMITGFHQSKAEPIFIPIGASSGILYRIWLIQLFAKNPVWLYPVDDLREIAVGQKKSLSIWMCNIFLPRIAKSARRIFAISDGLATVFSQLSGKAVDVILPCFQQVEPISTKISATQEEYIIVFTGGLSFLYNDSLLKFTVFLKTFSSSKNRRFKVIVQTYSSRQQFEDIGFDSSVVEYRTAENRDELNKTYAEADAFVVPYSFAPELAGVTTTSFPQKVAQLIQLNKPLVVFGPRYGSVVKFFAEHSLPFLITENSYDAFEAAMNRLVGNPGNGILLEKYQQTYRENFSQDICLSKLRNP